MSIAYGHIILALRDSGLRSMLSAQLGMAGEMTICATNYLDPALNRSRRSTSALIIEHLLIGTAAKDWAHTLRHQQWSGHIVIIVDDMPPDWQLYDTITLMGRRQAGAGVPALARLWRSRGPGALTQAR